MVDVFTATFNPFTLRIGRINARKVKISSCISDTLTHLERSSYALILLPFRGIAHLQFPLALLCKPQKLSWFQMNDFTFLSFLISIALTLLPARDARFPRMLNSGTYPCL